MCAVAIAAFPEFLNIFDGFLFSSLFLLHGFLHFVGSVSDRLHAIVDFSKLYLGSIARRDDLSDRRVHRFALPKKTLQVVVAFLSDMLPVLLRLARGEIIFVDEVHAGLQFIGGWHEVFGLKCRNVRCFHPDDAVGSLLRLRARRQSLPSPAQHEVVLEGALIRFERELRSFGEEVFVQDPVGLEKGILP